MDELTLSWQISSLTVATTTKSLFRRSVTVQHKLLQNVSGVAKSGSLLAVMGPSGSGKTSLLACLSQRLSGELKGEVHLNGRPVDKDLMLRISGFVPQHDLAVTCLTVLEHLQFMATLKMDRRVSQIQQQRIICSLIQDLGLSNCCNTLLSALSGGERKRVSLAVQMLTDPPILFCDEPTTGLDSYNAASVVKVLRTLTSRGKAVICSIHQPSSDVFLMFDKLCLLVPAGRLAYCGDADKAQTYFESLGYNFPSSYNPSDTILSLLNSPSQKKLDFLCESFKKSSLHCEVVKEYETTQLMAIRNQLVFGIEEAFLKFYSMKPPTQKTQLKWLMWRTTLSMVRNSQRLIIRFVMYMLVGLLISSQYTGMTLDQAAIQNMQGFHYSVITETIFCHTYSVMHTFPAEIPILLREMGNGVYHPGPYYFSKIMVMVPRVALETLLFCVVAFYVVGVEGGSLSFLVFASPALASAMVSSAYGCFVSTLFENISTASLFSVPLDFISYSFSGLFLQLSTLPFYLRWLKYISRFYYGVEAMSIIQWTKVKDIPCSSNPDIPCISTGVGVLQKYGFSPSNLKLDFLGLLLTAGVLHIFGFLALRRRCRQQSVY